MAVVLFVRRVRPRVALVANARPAGRGAPTPDRITREITHVFLQKKLLQKLGPGLMHAFIFWGFIVLLPTIAEAAVAIVDKDSSLPILGHAAWFAFISDVFATLVVVGIAMAFFIRKVLKPDRFRGSHMEEADRILLLDPRDRRDVPAVERLADRARDRRGAGCATRREPPLRTRSAAGAAPRSPSASSCGRTSS